MSLTSSESRRGFLRRAASVTAAICASSFPAFAQKGLFQRGSRKKAAPAAQPLVFFGTDSSKPGSKGIYVSRFNSQTGQLSAPILAAESSHPSFMAVANVRGRKVLYAVNEGNEHTSGVSAFALDPTSGSLKALGQVSSGGAGPCYISVDATGSAAFVANYSGGTVASFQVHPDGTLSQPVSRVDCHDAPFPKPGPMKQRQDGPHPHCATLSPTNRFLVVNDLGLDTITTFPVDTLTGKLGPAHVTAVKPGSGPRHLAFHPNGRWVYVVDELSNRVDQYLWSMVHGAPGQVLAAQALLTATGHSITTLAADASGTTNSAEIVMGPNGDHVYVSNRLAENSLVVFQVDGTTGALSFQQRIDCGGKTPRQFTLDPTGEWLLCGNQDSNSVTVFQRDQGTGRLTDRCRRCQSSLRS